VNVTRSVGVVLAVSLTVGTAASVSASPPPPWTLQYDSSQNNPYSPPSCLNEDDFHERQWTGSFSGTFVQTEYFCTPGVDVGPDGYNQWNGGGVGIMVQLSVTGTLSGLTINVPAKQNWWPALSQSAALVSTELVGHGRNAYTVNRYVGCVFPSSTNFPYGPLTGTVTMNLAGTFSNATYTITAEMFSFADQGYPERCPVGQEPP
jgi:hypothetical protein